jgi:hypothetical protein
MFNSIALGSAVWDLPPLILHPFNERVPPAALLENSKAALMLSGLIPSDGADPEELRKRVLSGRYSEIRMLFFLGKDVFRWIEQCMECTARIPELAKLGIERQSFAGFAASRPPEPVRLKLTSWGVADHIAIFTRAIGLNAMFCAPPPIDSVSDDFLRNYHRFADQMFQVFLESEPHTIISAEHFRFDLYASGEYTRKLESEWDTGEDAG